MKTTLILLTVAAMALPPVAQGQQIVTGQGAFADWTQEKPGIFRRITLADLPPPNAAESVRNQPHIVERPANA